MTKLTELVDAYLIDQRYQPRPRNYFYATDCSIDIKGIEGKCLRALHFDWTGVSAEIPDALSLRRMQLGKDIEIRERSRYRKLGILRHDIKRKRRCPVARLNTDLSCEIDAPVDFNGKLEIVEIKSFYGYYQTKELCGYFKGKDWIEGKPRINHLLQTIIYLELFKDLTDTARIVYIARDSEKYNEFVLKLNAKPSGVVVNGLWMPYSYEGILKRFLKFLDWHSRAEIPVCDFIPLYSEEYRKIKGLKPFNKRELPNCDWNCDYCSYHLRCLKESGRLGEYLERVPKRWKGEDKWSLWLKTNIKISEE